MLLRESKHCRRLAPLLGGLVMAMCVAAIAGGAPIKFHAGPVDLAAMQQAQPLAALTNTQFGQHVVLQFDAPLDSTQRAGLAAAGVKLLDPLGANAYFARIDQQRLQASGLPVDAPAAITRAIDVSWKLDAELAAGVTPWHAVLDDSIPENPLVAAYVMFHRDVDVITDGTNTAGVYGAVIRDVVWANNSLVVEAPLDRIHAMATDDNVQWVEFAKPSFSHMNTENRALTQANQAQAAPYNLDGSGVTVMIYDGGTARSSHVDFGGRLTVRDSSGTHYHSTHVAATVGGDGTASSGAQRGMAPNVTLLAYGFEYDGSGTFLYSNPGDIQNDYNQAINTYGADVSNNSIGSNIEANFFSCSYQGNYGVTSNLIDSIVRGSLGGPFRIFWAASNERQGTRCNVEGFGDYYSISTPSGAKNHISVGAVNANDDSMTSFSGWGPTDDGRMIPHVSAPGCQNGGDNGVTSAGDGSNTEYISLCGTSMASPTACGVGALIIQDFRNQYPGDPDLRNSTLKALLAQGAVDRGNPGPDYQFGYGSIRAVNSIDLLRSGNFLEDELDQGVTLSYNVAVSPGDSELKVTLAWDDYPGTPNVNPALVNDLDLRVYDPSENRYFPWTLNPSNPSGNAVQTAENRVDNIEQVLVSNPTSGTWRVDVVGYAVPQGPQTFSLVSSNAIVFGPSLSVGLLSSIPDLIPPGAATPLDVRVRAVSQNLIAGSPTLHFRYDGGAWLSTPLTLVSGETFQGVLPPATCDATPEFYFSAEGDATGVTVSPAGAPASAHTATIGVETVVFADNFQSDLGWTVQNDGALTDGPWERGVPIGGGDRGDPASDYDGSGACYLTDNVDDNSDVDGGITWLISPTFDMSGGGVAMEFAIWYTNNTGDDPDNDLFHVALSDDGGSSWNTFLTLGPTSSAGWQAFSYNVDDITSVTPTSNMKLRFECSDLNSGSIVEAGVDAVRLYAGGCSAAVTDCNGNQIADSDDIASGRSADGNGNGVPDECEANCDGFMIGDVNCDGLVNFGDIDPFVLALTDAPAYDAAYPGCDRLCVADINADGFVNFGDIDGFVALITN